MGDDRTPPSAQALWLERPGAFALRDEPVAQPGPEEACVTTHYSAVSRGTESLVFAGQVPTSEASRMRAPFQAGEFPAPVKYGYCSVGVVEGSDERVFCLYPHQSRYVVPAAALARVPDDVPSARAVLAANMETAVNALWDAPVRVGDRVAVVGAGVVGCLVGYLATRVPGTRVELIDLEPARAPVAEALGCGFALPADAAGRADRVFHTSASDQGLALALSLAAFEAEVIELSWYGARDVSAALGAAFHSQRLTLRASQVGSISPSRRATHDYAARMALSLSLLANPALDVLFTHELDFASLADNLPLLLGPLPAGSSASPPLAVRVRYPAAPTPVAN